MDPYTLMNNLATAVADDATLKAWSQTYYGRDHQVYLGEDMRDLPGDADGPNVQFHSYSKSADEENRIVDYAIGFYVVLYDEDTITRAEANVTEYAAPKRMAEIISRIMVVIRAAKPSGYVMAYDVMTGVAAPLPNFDADVAVMFREKILIGQDPLG